MAPKVKNEKDQTLPVPKQPRVSKKPSEYEFKVLAEQIRANEIAKEANEIAKKPVFSNWIAVFINTCLLGITIFLTIYNIEGIKSAIKSAKAADSTVKIARETLDSSISYNNRTAVAQHKSDSIMQGYNQTKSKRDSQSISTQILAFKATQKQFEIGNEPFLQVTELNLEPINVGQPINITYNIENLGNYPVIITKGLEGIGIDSKSIPFEDLLKGVNLLKNYNTYLIKGMVIPPSEVKGEIIQNSSILNELTAKNKFIYFAGYFEYINLVTNKKKSYKFIVQLANDGHTHFVLNKNGDNPVVL